MLVVLESPFAGNTESNIDYARRCMRDCIERGEIPIASHLLYTQPKILNDDDPAERQLGIELGYAWGSYADKVVVYRDRGVSTGMQAAVDFYRLSLGMEVEYRYLPIHLLDTGGTRH